MVLDDRNLLWTGYGCEGWPSLFLWGRGGILQWFHFGEGDYRSTEEAIQASLGKAGADAELPEPMGAIRETDVQGIEVIAPGAELIPAEGRAWTIEEDGEAFDIEYEGGGIHVTAGRLRTASAHRDRRRSHAEAIEIDGPGLYTAWPSTTATGPTGSRSNWSAHPRSGRSASPLPRHRPGRARDFNSGRAPSAGRCGSPWGA